MRKDETIKSSVSIRIRSSAGGAHLDPLARLPAVPALRVSTMRKDEKIKSSMSIRIRSSEGGAHLDPLADLPYLRPKCQHCARTDDKKQHEH